MDPNKLKKLDEFQGYIQLGLLNVALLIILLKQINLIYALISFAFIFILISMINHHLVHRGQMEKDQSFVVLFNEALSQKIRRVRSDFAQKLDETEKQHQEKKKNYFLVLLVVVYFCLVFVEDWMESFIFLNFVYIYFFMPQIFTKSKKFIWAVCNNQCPISYKKD